MGFKLECDCDGCCNCNCNNKWMEKLGVHLHSISRSLAFVCWIVAIVLCAMGIPCDTNENATRLTAVNYLVGIIVANGFGLLALLCLCCGMIGGTLTTKR